VLSPTLQIVRKVSAEYFCVMSKTKAPIVAVCCSVLLKLCDDIVPFSSKQNSRLSVLGVYGSDQPLLRSKCIYSIVRGGEGIGILWRVRSSWSPPWSTLVPKRKYFQ
jgi:hypothetical protein